MLACPPSGVKCPALGGETYGAGTRVVASSLWGTRIQRIMRIERIARQRQRGSLRTAERHLRKQPKSSCCFRDNQKDARNGEDCVDISESATCTLSAKCCVRHIDRRRAGLSHALGGGAPPGATSSPRQCNGCFCFQQKLMADSAGGSPVRAAGRSVQSAQSAQSVFPKARKPTTRANRLSARKSPCSTSAPAPPSCPDRSSAPPDSPRSPPR